MRDDVISQVGRHVDAHRRGDVADAESYLDSLSIRKKNIITIAGQSGAGVSTITDVLARALDYRSFHAGELYRTLATQYGMSLEELDDFSRSSPVIDREIDKLIRRLGEGNEIVLAARLGYYWIHDSFKVYLTVDEETAARRVHEAVARSHKDGAEGVSVIEANDIARKQRREAAERYFRTYGIDTSNTNPFDLVINTDDSSPEEVAALIRRRYNEWQAGQERSTDSPGLPPE